MFDPNYEVSGARRSQWAIGGLAVLSLVSLIVTALLLLEVPHELQILEELKQHLPAADRPEANELAGELRLQSRLSLLLIANLVASAIALAMLVRAYFSNQTSLKNVHVLASDIVTSLDQGVMTTDEEGVVLSINPRGRELLEDAKIGIGVALGELPTHHRPLEELCQTVLRTQNHIRDWDYVSRTNGNERHLRAGCSLLRDHDGRRRGTVIHLRDVTEKTLMEQRMRRMERYMGLGSLAAGLQHEIKNPLSALSLHVQLLKESIDEQQISSTVRESLCVLSTEVRRITGVLESFRDFASVARLDLADTDLAKLIIKMVKLTEHQARQQNVEVKTQLPMESIPPIAIDALRIEQVLLNLMLNAMAAMDDGGTLTVRLRAQSHTVEIEVADTGGGVPDNLRDKIFDPYFTTRSTGTGMGLALCEKIVRQHEGSIDFTSGSEGTVFVVTLPRHVTT